MRVSLEAYRLNFYSGVHLGTREGALEGTETIIRSDTLFSAFINGYRLLYEGHRFQALADLMKAGESPLRFSSAFPFVGDDYYLPVPLNQIPKDKEAKKVLFVDWHLWEKLINGEDLEKLMASGRAKVLPRPVSGDDPQDLPVWQVTNTPRVGLDRQHSHPGERFFHCGEVHFAEDAGLYFLARYDDDQLRDEARAVWRLMADEGIGGDRTVGKGLYTYPKPVELTLEAPDEAEGWIALSLYYPADDEMLGLSEGYYDLVTRRGYIYSQGGRTLRRCPVSMFAEGSVFPLASTGTGKLVDVTPESFTRHPVYRSGLAVGVPCISRGSVS